MNTPLSLIVLLSTLLLGQCGNMNPTLSSSNRPSVACDTIDVELKMANDYSRRITPELHGYNTPNFFHFYDATDSELQSILDEISPRLIRFPGGTTANFYHPKQPAYGYNISDVELMNPGAMKNKMLQIAQKEKTQVTKTGIQRNFLEDLITFSKKNNAKVLYVANLFSGTNEEVLFALRKLKASGVEIAGVELGNEYYLKAYQKVFPGAKEYLKKAKQVSMLIRKEFPGLKVGVVAAPDSKLKGVSGNEAELLQAWNTAIASAIFYDAYVAHLYMFPVSCQGMDTPPLFECANELTNSFIAEGLPAAMEAYKALFGNRKLWVTEWNTHGASKYFGDCMFLGQFYTEFAMQLANFDHVEYACYHNLLAQGLGFNLVQKNNRKRAQLLGSNYVRLMPQLAASVISETHGALHSKSASDRPIPGLSIDALKNEGELEYYITNRTPNVLSITLPKENTLRNGLMIHASNSFAELNKSGSSVTKQSLSEQNESPIYLAAWSISKIRIR